MDIQNLSKKFYPCYSKDLCYPKIRNKWDENNKYFGMCAITSLIINDYYGGEICKIYVNGISHYFNFINNRIIDLTSKQFEHQIDYSNYEIVKRNDILVEDTQQRYILLKERLEELK